MRATGLPAALAILPKPRDACRPTLDALPNKRTKVPGRTGGGRLRVPQPAGTAKFTVVKGQYWSGSRTRDRPTIRRLLYPTELSSGGVSGSPARARHQSPLCRFLATAAYGEMTGYLQIPPHRRGETPCPSAQPQVGDGFSNARGVPDLCCFSSH